MGLGPFAGMLAIMTSDIGAFGKLYGGPIAKDLLEVYTTVVRAVPELESRGRIPLLDGRPEAVAALAQRGLDRLAAGRGKVPAAARPALIACHMAAPLLAQVVRDPQRVADGAMEVSEFTRRWGLLKAAFGRV